MTWKIRIIETETDEVHVEMDAPTERAAERIERGASINLNHDLFHIEIEEEEDEE